MKKKKKAKKQDPRDIERKKEFQHKLNRPLRGDQRSDADIKHDNWVKHREQTVWNPSGSRPSPNFGQDKAWVREGREPSWSKDREHLMRIFNKNVEDMLEPAARKRVPHPLRYGDAGRSDREARYLKEYNATGLGDLSRSMRMTPVPIGKPKTYNMFSGEWVGTSANARAMQRMRKEYLEGFRFSDSYRDDESIDIAASSIPRRHIYMRGEERTIWLDHNRDKSLDTPAVAREMALYDQVHPYLQKQDKGVRAALNVFRGRGFTRR